MPIAADLHYYYHEGGNKDTPPVILIHGAGGSGLSWPANLRRLTGVRVFSIELPGHGLSVGAGRQSVRAYAEAVQAFMDANDCYRAILVGHSLGGCIALDLALRHPDRIQALGMVSSGAHVTLPAGLLEQARNPSTYPRALDALQALAFSPQASDSLVQALATDWRKARPGVLHADLLALSSFDAAGRLGEVNSPVLVAVGEDDRLTPPGPARALAAALPQGRLVVIPGAGHMLPHEQPAALRQHLSAFLAGLVN